MRKLFFMALFIVSGVAHAETGKNQLFNCMDNVTFELNSECMSSTIASNVRFKDAESKMLNVAAVNGDYAIATMTFDPEKMQIDVVAHRDALNAKNFQLPVSF